MHNNDKDDNKVSGINCGMCMVFVERFFTNGVTPTVKDYVLAHLLTCPECAKAYEEYAEKIGLHNFKLVDFSIEFVKDRDKYANQKNIKKTSEVLNKMGYDIKMEIRSHKWTDAASKMDIEKLMQLKFFRDLSQEEITYNEKDINEYYKYGKHLTLKLAKRVDHLEECLLKEYKGEHEQCED